MQRLTFLVLFLITLASAQSETPEVTSDTTTTGAGELMLHVSFLTNATPEKLWRALTVPDELTKWAAKRVRVELRLGGAYEYYHRPENPVGRRGMEGTKIVSFVPGKMLSYSANSDLWTVWMIEPAGDQQVIHLYIIGSNADWVDRGHERFTTYSEQVQKLAAYVQP